MHIFFLIPMGYTYLMKLFFNLLIVTNTSQNTYVKTTQRKQGTILQ